MEGDAALRAHLHDEARCDDRGDAELHERAAVRREDDAHPVERVRRLGALHAIDRDLHMLMCIGTRGVEANKAAERRRRWSQIQGLRFVREPSDVRVGPRPHRGERVPRPRRRVDRILFRIVFRDSGGASFA